MVEVVGIARSDDLETHVAPCDLDIRLLLRHLRLKPEETEQMEHELVEWFKEWHKEGRPQKIRAGKAGKLRIVGVMLRIKPDTVA